MSGSASKRMTRIGGASGFWGDSAIAVPQLLGEGNIQYLVFDYLAELTMAILASARRKNPETGYAVDFVGTIASSLREISAQGIRVIANAGGVNPHACAAALTEAAARQGLHPKIAIVVGDDVMPLIDTLRHEKVTEIQSGKELPSNLLTANAYLGALPIKRALDLGADIVITGRCVDSAVTLGALMHEFNWKEDEYDKLAAGSLAGHIIECGCQGTGGLHTDWRLVTGWDNMGYPIIEARADGSFVVAKPKDTGGLITPAVISEQILYEVGDPAAYKLPDVVCDFSQVRLRQDGDNRVEVDKVRGLPPTDTYKVCATYLQGYKCATTLMVIGFDAAEKAQRMAEAILARTGAINRSRDYGDYTDALIEVIGAESVYGPHASSTNVREVSVRISVTHGDKRALEVFASELGAAGSSWAPGATGISGRPKVSPSIRLFSFLLNKQRLAPQVTINGIGHAVSIPAGVAPRPQLQAVDPVESVKPSGDTVEVPLISLAFARSGDKGNSSNIGVIARREEYLPYLRSEVSAERVAAYLAHLVSGKVTRFDAPGISAMNFLCEEALGGGVAASLRYDPWGKGMAQILLSMPVTVPRDLVK